MERLIDTDIFVDHLRRHPPAREFFLTLTDAGISTVTQAELLAGIENNTPAIREKLIRMLHQWGKKDVTRETATVAGDIMREHGTKLGDALIAATAIIHDMTLCTRNLKHFSHIPGLNAEAPY